MKYIDYMEDHPGENMSWCRPYKDAHGNYLIVNDNRDIAIYNGGVVSTNPTETELEKFAKIVNVDYDDYNGYDAMEIALDTMSETGCWDCPLKFECEVMSANLENEEGEE